MPTSTALVGQWRRIADIPTSRSEVAAVGFRGTAIVLGGFGGPSVVEQYLPGSDSWRRLPDLPVGVDHPMAAAVEDGPHAGVYLIGGNTAGRPSARVFHLSADLSTWRELRSMPAPRSQGAAAAVDEVIYVVGGIATGNTLHLTTYVFDTRTGLWAQRADIPTPRDHLGAAVLGGRVCAAGGRVLSMARNLAALECFDPGPGTWERLPGAPTARGGVGVAAIGDRLFLIGGEEPAGTFPHLEIYDAATREWSRGPDLGTPRHGIGVVALGTVVYVLTGGPTPGGSQTEISEAIAVR